MKYQDLIEYAKMVFNFNPAIEFQSIEHVLHVGRKARSTDEYIIAVSSLTEALARYADQQNAV